jgi:hypothetical protein
MKLRVGVTGITISRVTADAVQRRALNEANA